MSMLVQQSLPRKDDDRINIKEFSGFLIYVGKNAVTNERIVTEHEHRDCLWLHAAGAKGSCVILCHCGKEREFTDDSIQFAGALALKHSRSQARLVIFARLSDVIKMPRSSAGVFLSTKRVQIEIV